jgi:hypothetical protein
MFSGGNEAAPVRGARSGRGDWLEVVPARVNVNGADARPDARAGHRRRRLLTGPAGPDLLNLAQRRLQVGQPGVLVLADQTHAPGQRVTAAAGYAAVY